MRVLITGANGFIGMHLIKYIRSRGVDVLALSRSGILSGVNVDGFKWQLGDVIPNSTLDGVTHAIHLAYDFNGDAGAKKTHLATLELVNQLRAVGVKRQLFFSSYSAGEHAISRYGKTKYIMEQSLIEFPDLTIVRPGLVLGEAGIYGRIYKMVEKLPIVPLPDGGYGKVPIIDIEKLTRETYQLLSEKYFKQANLFEHELCSLRSLVKTASKQLRKKIYILNIPSSIILFSLRFLEYLPLKLPVSADNLQGFLANQDAMHLSTLNE